MAAAPIQSTTPIESTQPHTPSDANTDTELFGILIAANADLSLVRIPSKMKSKLRVFNAAVRGKFEAARYPWWKAKVALIVDGDGLATKPNENNFLAPLVADMIGCRIPYDGQFRGSALFVKTMEDDLVGFTHSEAANLLSLIVYAKTADSELPGFILPETLKK